MITTDLLHETTTENESVERDNLRIRGKEQ